MVVDQEAGEAVVVQDFHHLEHVEIAFADKGFTEPGHLSQHIAEVDIADLAALAK